MQKRNHASKLDNKNNARKHCNAIFNQMCIKWNLEVKLKIKIWWNVTAGFTKELMKQGVNVLKMLLPQEKCKQVLFS